ncbi:MAG: DUF1501 domain-containing protein [Planctomycetia bacterium]|nr:DUF1501 domain-containing protein [Planctomycetia bacterium]
MLIISDKKPNRTCEGTSRRDFLRIGALGLGALTLPNLLALKAAAPAVVRDKSVVLLFLQGGPPQHETFDPHMEASAEYRSATGEVKTALPGITFGADFPKLAKMTDRLAVIRSYQSRNGGHTYSEVLSANNAAKATVSSIAANLGGPVHPTIGIPSNVVLLPEAVKEGLKLRGNFETGALPTLTSPGILGSQYEAFNPVGGAALKKAMELRIPTEQFEDRKKLLAAFDDVRRESEPIFARVDKFQQQALDVIARGIGEAFDVDREDSKTLEKYDSSKLFKMEDYTKFVNMNRTTNLLGRQMLLARRLVENGVRFVTVSDCGWDLHADSNSAKGMSAMSVLGGQVDHAVSAFLDDIKARGLEDKVLLVVTGEMGRTPRINKRGGRDHWGDLTPLLVAGGGMKMGQVIGKSDSLGGRPSTEPYTPANLLATILHFLFDVTQLRLRTDIARDLKPLLENAEPISQLA